MKSFLLKTILFLIFLFAFFLLIFSAKQDSLTTDEAVHLFAGYTYITRNASHSFRLDPEHPPFLKEIAAVPLLFFQNLKVPIDGLWDKAGNFYVDSWQEARVLSEQFLFGLGNNADKLIFWGRFPFIILTLILGFAVYWWSRKIYGEKAGIFAAFLILFLPNILAHGRLINTDLGLTLFIFLAIYYWTKFLKSASWRTTWLGFLMSGVFTGLAFASKFTSLILVPILIVLMIAKLIYDKDFKKWPKYLVGFLGVMVIGFIIVWASYGFSVQAPPKPLGSLSENIKLWTSFNVPNSLDVIFQKIRPILFPADFYKGFFLVGRHALAGHGSFLLGQTSNTGWWYYFPVAIFMKTPIPFFIFLILAIIFWKKIKTKESFDEVALLAAPIIFLIISMFTKADLGVRHILPIFPFLAVYASKSINLVDFSKVKIPVILFSILILWYLLSTISSYSNYLAYFNEAAGGPKRGFKILADSNLDWGQDIFRIKKYLDEHQITDGYILYPWNGDQALKYYGINLKSMPWDDQNIKGNVVVSATYLQLADLSWLWQYPYEQITPGVFIFRLD